MEQKIFDIRPPASTCLTGGPDTLGPNQFLLDLLIPTIGKNTGTIRYSKSHVFREGVRQIDSCLTATYNRDDLSPLGCLGDGLGRFLQTVRFFQFRKVANVRTRQGNMEFHLFGKTVIPQTNQLESLARNFLGEVDPSRVRCHHHHHGVAAVVADDRLAIVLHDVVVFVVVVVVVVRFLFGLFLPLYLWGSFLFFLVRIYRYSRLEMNANKKIEDTPTTTSSIISFIFSRGSRCNEEPDPNKRSLLLAECIISYAKGVQYDAPACIICMYHDVPSGVNNYITILWEEREEFHRRKGSPRLASPFSDRRAEDRSCKAASIVCTVSTVVVLVPAGL